VDVIAREIRRLDEVIQRFLQFVRPVEVSFAPVRIAPLVAGVIDVVRPEAQRAGVAVESKCLSDSLSVDGDAVLLRDALLNLAQNAVQAMPQGGRLTMACATAADGRIEIRVADTGAGIPPEHLAMIFDLYFTTKSGGSGVGLPTVYRTMTVHNGEIAVESVEGHGTTFTLTLPALQSR
jgi:signal transduction histidine kinase